MRDANKNFVITRPKLKSIVSVWTDPKRVYRAVVSGNQEGVEPDKVRVLTLPEKREEVVPWNCCKHSSV